MRFLLGAAWYPEWEPPGAWEKDIARMKEAGLNAVRIAEFSWEAMWPEPDRFDFNLYDQVMQHCEDEGMTVVLGIDTVRPPSWLFELEPDMRLVDNKGHTAPGIWPTLCFNHPRFTHYSEQLIRELVNRYKNSPVLDFYQLDNEPAYHNRGEVRRDPQRYYCYCHNCQRAFKSWLEAKYIERFEDQPKFQTPFPDPEIMGEQLWIEWRLFHEETHKRRIGWIAEQVRRWDKVHPMTTNLMVRAAWGSGMAHSVHDVYGINEHLDIFGMDFYGDVCRDYTIPESMVYAASRHWGGDKGFHCLELQPTTLTDLTVGNGGISQGVEKNGDDRKLIPWGWRPLAYGAKSLFYWVWRLQYVNIFGLAEPDGRVSSFGKQTARLANEIEKVWPHIADSIALPSQVAILHSRPSAYLAARQDVSYVSAESLEGAFAACWANRIQADVVDVRAALKGALSRYKVVLAPYLTVMPDDLAQALRDYVASGGTLIADTRFATYGEPFVEYGTSFLKLNVLHVPTAGLDELTGCRVLKPYRSSQPPVTHLRDSEQPVKGVWYWEELEVQPGAEVLATFLDSAPALVRNTYGKGNVYYSAIDLFRACRDGTSEGVSLLRDVLSAADVQAEIDVADYDSDPLALEVVLRGNQDGASLAFVINSSPNTVTPTLTFSLEAVQATELITARSLTVVHDGQHTTLTLELHPYSVQVLHLGSA